VNGWKGVRVCYYWVCALRIDAAKMCTVDAMCTSVFPGTFYVFRCCVVNVAVMFLLLLYGSYVYVTRCMSLVRFLCYKMYNDMLANLI
jgi:hypothetical protein